MTETTMSIPAGPRTNTKIVVTFIFCILASLADGFDLQSTGITATHFRAELGLTTAQLSWVFVWNSAGLFVGASAGGWIADRIGRRWVMILSMALFGTFSVVTALITDGSMFAPVRFLTGIGLGAALANIIALVSETGSPKNRATQVTVLTASNPLGGAIPGALMSIWPDLHWRLIFHIGGWWPLALAVLMLLWLPESNAFAEKKRARASMAKAEPNTPIGAVLFGDRRTTATLSLWVAFFFCLLVIYLMISWLPLLLIGQGYSTREASFAALCFPFGGAVGTVLLGLLMARLSAGPVMILSFAGIVAAVSALAIVPHDLTLMLIAAFFVGFFVIGTQYLLYGLSPLFYPSRMRGTGVGVAVAIGRLGSIAGPALAGVLLSAGRSPTEVLLSILPGVTMAFIAALVLSRAEPARDE